MIETTEQAPWLDLHILILPQTNPDWVQQCLRSVREAVAFAGFPVAVHALPATYGHVGRERARGYAQGSAPYVTQVDEDDFITVHALEILREHLVAKVDAIFPQEMIVPFDLPEGDDLIMHPLQKGRQRHSMKVFRREHLIDHSQWIWAGDTAQMCSLETRCTRLVDSTDPSYYYRVYPQSASRPMRLQYPTELLTARRGDAPLLSPQDP